MSAIQGNIAFKDLPEAKIRGIAHKMTEIKVAAGEACIREGDVGHNCYVVASGSFNVFKAGRDEPLCTYGQGQAFGELALLYDAPRAASVIAEKSGHLFVLDRATFKHLTTSHTGEDLRDMYEMNYVGAFDSNEGERKW